VKVLLKQGISTLYRKSGHCTYKKYKITFFVDSVTIGVGLTEGTLAPFELVELVLLTSPVAPKLVVAFTASSIESGRTIGFKGAESVVAASGFFSSKGFRNYIQKYQALHM
jgi:hypothetical protein